ncbi:MAG TPA: sugar ABC transporter permease [Actinomycetota bacterium]|nr:sugar ABC transporter permease [Actinomycetota bacterium]
MTRTRWFFAPVLMGSILLVVLPAVLTVGMAFTHYDGLTTPSPAGFDNFRRALGDSLFWTSLRNSLIFAGMVVPLRLLVALGAALLLAPSRRGVTAGRTLLALPTFVPDVAYAIAWTWILNPIYGPIAGLLRTLGFDATDWLISAWGARWGLVFMSLFQIAESFVIVLAVRNEIPGELYELADLEGASRSHVFRRVTLPLLAPTLVLLAARDVAFSLQASFVPGLIVTEGGPKFATTFLPFYVYQNAFGYLSFGYAAAMTLVMFLVSAAMVGVQLVAVKRFRRSLLPA